MIKFKKLNLCDIEKIRPKLMDQKNRICDYTIGGLLMWRDFFHTEFCIIEDTLLLKVTYLNGENAFSYPVGKHHKSMLQELQKYCINKHIKLEFCTITKDNLEHLRMIFSNLEIQEERDWFDYLYDAEALKEFRGKKYNKIRNHLNNFHHLYPNWSFDKLQEKDIDEVLQFYENFQSKHVKESSTSLEESIKVKEVLQHYMQYGLLGGILRVDSKIIAFSIGEVINDTLFVHVEKANTEYKGVYQKIVSSFAQMYVTEDIRYINREEDVGDEGLRQSKMAYRPIKLLAKYTVRVQDAI